MNVRLIRRTIGTSAMGWRYWEIAGTNLVVRRTKGQWRIVVDPGGHEADSHDTHLWLADSDLGRAVFARRGEALRAYAAAAALSPPPARTENLAQLRYLGPGRYDHPDTGMTVTRDADRRWVICAADGGQTGKANTLRIARNQVAKAARA